MGQMPSPPNCYFTGLPTTNMISDVDAINYFIKIDEKKIGFNLESTYDWANSDLVKDNLSILRGDIYNWQWPIKNQYIDEKEIIKIIQLSTAPRLPKEKLDNLFLKLFNIQKVDGKEFRSDKIFYEEQFWRKLYFKDVDEFNFYLKTLDDFGLIDAKINPSKFVVALSITFKGLNYQLELTESGANSNNCFIAMSFTENLKEIRDAIKLAVVETGYNPIIIDEIHLDADKTINDEIIANIKKSKFCISDFTEQKDGVYFEAGYALGRGLKVIYTCQENWFAKTHFDTNHFPHIIYKEPSLLTESLNPHCSYGREDTCNLRGSIFLNSVWGTTNFFLLKGFSLYLSA